jgi:hypothetical protein
MEYPVESLEIISGDFFNEFVNHGKSILLDIETK